MTVMFRRHAGTAVGAAVLMLAIASSGIALTRDSGESARDSGRGAIPEVATPCGGEKSDLENASAAVPFDIIVPNSALANPRNLEGVWLCSRSEVLLTFASEASVLEGINTLKDPAAEWAGLAESYPEFTVGSLGGVPASLATPDEEIGANGGVDFVIENVRYTVTGNQRVPLDDLLSVAESLSVQVKPA
jgi:hypothetical protein